MLFCALSQPGWSISKAPEEGEVVPDIDPATYCHCLVVHDRGLVDQPVELHCSLDQQGEHLRGDGCVRARQDHSYIKPALRRNWGMFINMYAHACYTALYIKYYPWSDAASLAQGSLRTPRPSLEPTNQNSCISFDCYLSPPVCSAYILLCAAGWQTNEQSINQTNEQTNRRVSFYNTVGPLVSVWICTHGPRS